MRALSVLLAVLLGAPPPTVQVTVRLVGVRVERGGVIHAALHAAPGVGFPGPAPSGNVDVAPARETVVVFQVEPGTYAVAAHHDQNANGRMDANFLGIPKEGYGVSNDPRPKFRAPRFSEAQVAVTKDTTLTVRMAY